MAAGASSPPRRPFCFRCSKAARLCLCSRIPSPPIDNPVGVTVLQHRREACHPLNSARLAALGLRNFDLVPVSDVNFCSLFVISPLVTPSQEDDSVSIAQPRLTDENMSLDNQIKEKYKQAGDKCFVSHEENRLCIFIERGTRPNLSSACASPVYKEILKHGFTVKKLQRRQLPGTMGFEDFEEFRIKIPCGSIFLFPGKKSIAPEEVDFRVEHVFVLDGTWAKARRMCYENPWLQFLPRLQLVTDKKSLYNEVRHQPKDGCLSTIESIICAMKVLGFDMDGYDDLLDVFASMIGDQIRCKDEKFSAIAQS